MAGLDTYRAVKQLQEAGVPEAQAAAYVQLLEEATDEPSRVLVTRAHLQAALYRVLALGMGGSVAIAAVAAAVAEAL